MTKTSFTAPPQADPTYTDTPSEGLWAGRMRQIRGRVGGLALALVAEIAIIALLLTLSWNVAGIEDQGPNLVTIEARNITDTPSPEDSEPAPAESEPTREVTPPNLEPPQLEPETPQPLTVEPPSITLSLPDAPPIPPPPAPAPAPPPKQQTPPAKSAKPYGPPDTGSSGSQFDSRRVGTAPNGEPMYAARWYREPTRQELAGYLSTAIAPSTALVVCRTVPDFYVEDCELLGENPRGSNIGRAVLAATWQFRVRPAIVGGRSQVGSWVRIRIDYNQAVQR